MSDIREAYRILQAETPLDQKRLSLLTMAQDHEFALALVDLLLIELHARTRVEKHLTEGRR